MKVDPKVGAESRGSVLLGLLGRKRRSLPGVLPYPVEAGPKAGRAEGLSWGLAAWGRSMGEAGSRTRSSQPHEGGR